MAENKNEEYTLTTEVMRAIRDLGKEDAERQEALKFGPVLMALSGAEPTTIVEPPGVDWEIEAGSEGVISFSPPELERVTIVYEQNGHRLECRLFDRDQVQHGSS